MKANRQEFRNLIGAAAIAGCVLQMASIRVQADSVQQGSDTGASYAALDGPRSTVNYNDLDLSRPAGINTLEVRIRRAVESVCEQSGDKSLSRVHAERECREAAFADARAQVHALSVSATVAGQSERRCIDPTVADAVAQVEVPAAHEGTGP